jgi:hypothetical protein
VKYIVNYSGGLSSHVAAKLLVDEVGRENVTLLFCDTRSEDRDLYRFLFEGARALRCSLVIAQDGRDIWQVMHDERYLANTRSDPCSKILKRKLADRWVKARYKPGECVRVFGYSSCQDERERADRTAARLAEKGYATRFPLIEHGVSSEDVKREHAELFPQIPVPYLYTIGAEHNNCGGLCVKAGQKHFAWALKAIPRVYAEWEKQEALLREKLGNVAILRDRRGGTTKPLPLSVFRERMEAGQAPVHIPGEKPCTSCFEGADDEAA